MFFVGCMYGGMCSFVRKHVCVPARSRWWMSVWQMCGSLVYQLHNYRVGTLGVIHNHEIFIVLLILLLAGSTGDV